MDKGVITIAFIPLKDCHALAESADNEYHRFKATHEVGMYEPF